MNSASRRKPYLFVAFCLAATFSAAADEATDEATIGDDTLLLHPLVLIPWSSDVPGDVVVQEIAPGDSAIELGGPRQWPSRPALELYGSALGVVGRLVRGDGTVVPMALVLDDGAGFHRVALAEGPLALAPAPGGGVWAMYGAEIEQVAGDGTVLANVERGLTVSLVGRSDGGVWLIGGGWAQAVGATGTALGAPVEADLVELEIAAHGDGFCGRQRSAERAFVCYAADGSPETVTLSPELGLFDRVVAAGEPITVVEAGDHLSFYVADGDVRELPLQSAGLTSDGLAFASQRTPTGVRVVVEGAGLAELPFPDDVPPLGAFSVVGATGGQFLAYGPGLATWYDAVGHIARVVPIPDYDTLNAEVFPYQWVLTPLRHTAVGGDRVLVSTTGPSGIAILQVGFE